MITLVSLSLLVRYIMLRTGTLWFSVGFHFAFDYMQLFLIGTQNGALFPVGQLDVRFSGPSWLTGDVFGTEASFLIRASAAPRLVALLRQPATPVLGDTLLLASAVPNPCRNACNPTSFVGKTSFRSNGFKPNFTTYYHLRGRPFLFGNRSPPEFPATRCASSSRALLPSNFT